MIKALWRGWLVVAKKIAKVQSFVILSVVYFVFVAPFALAVRFFTDPLSLRRDPTVHWLPPGTAGAVNLDTVRQQF